MRIMVLQPNMLGDVIVATPLLRQMRTSLPGVHIAVVLGPLNRDIAPLLGDLIDEVVPYEKSLTGLARLWWTTRRPRFDWLVDLAEERLGVSRAVVALAGARRSVGFENGHRGLYDVTLPILPRDRVHIVDRYLTALEPIGIPTRPTDPRLELHLSDGIIAWADTIWPHPEAPTVLVNVSGTGAAKAWGVDRYAALVTAIRERHRAMAFAITGHSRDAATIDALVTRLGVPRLPPTPTFEHFAAVIRRADYVVTPETSALHLCAAWRRPCLGLYVQRPGGDNWTPYRSPGVKILSPSESVADISVADVSGGFDELVELVRTRGDAP